MKKSIYQRANEALPAQDIDHHESDLYLRKTPAADAIIAGYEYKNNVSVFRDAIEHALWYEIPFAYDPFWQGRARK